MPHLTKVLVVDDDESTRELIAEILGDERYLVCSARDAISALAAIESDRPDLILLDLRMPAIDGVDLFRILCERALATMPIILMTADNHAMQEMIAQGVKYILLKPFDLDTLLDCVAEALQSPQETQEQGVLVAVMEDEDIATLSQEVHICA